MRKKAQFDIANIVAAYLGFFLFLIIFILLFGVAKGCSMAKLQGTHKLEIIGEMSQKPVSSIILLNYLKTPVEINGKESTMAELFLASSDEGCKYSGFLEGVFRADPNQQQHNCGKEANKDYDSEKLISESKKIFDSVFGQSLWYIEVSHPNFKTKDGFFNVIFPYNEEAGIARGQDNKGLLPNRCNAEFKVNDLKSVITTSATIPLKDGSMTIVLGFCKRTT